MDEKTKEDIELQHAVRGAVGELETKHKKLTDALLEERHKDQQIAVLQAENERLRDALEYFIKQLDREKEHEIHGCHYCGSTNEDSEHYQNCPYTKAQEALKGGDE